MGVALPAIALLVLQMLQPMPELAAWSAGLESLFYFYAEHAASFDLRQARAAARRREQAGFLLASVGNQELQIQN